MILLTQDRQGPLTGIRILDLTRVLSGPYTSMMLADLGAEVIKLEMPEIGDDSRHFGPFQKDESAYFMSVNRNKKSITLNLKSEKGKEIFKKLAAQVDVILENYRPGTMEKLGLDYDTICQVNPGIIYASISGFGQTGPYSRRAAYDGIVQAMGGIMGITGEKGEKPVKIGSSIGDIIAGMFCSTGILAAYIHRQNTGKGQYIDVAMLDSQVAILENAIARYTVTGKVPKPTGNTHTSIFPFETFPTASEDIMIAAGNDVLWGKLCTALDCEELITDERFSTNPERGYHHDEMFALLCERLVGKKADEWVKILDDAGVPCSLINTIDKVLENPQIQARNMIVEVEHPKAGKNLIAGLPIKMSLTPGAVYKAAPVLGEDNRSVYKEMAGIGEDELEELKKKGVI